MDRWSGKVALITGASEGIGEAIAVKLVEHGMKVVGCARNFEKLSEVSEKINKSGKGKMFPFKCDVSKEEEILKMFEFIKERFGTIHCCINNAGILPFTSILDGKTSDWERMFQVNVIGLMVCTRESVKLMRATGVNDGHIINLNSISGHHVGQLPVYSATKFAVQAINHGTRLELIKAKSNIRSTQISPGIVETSIAEKHSGREIAEKIFSHMECLKAEDIAETVLYILALPPRANVNDVIIRPTQQT